MSTSASSPISARIREPLAGVLTCLALIPEVISFSAISRVDPASALWASVVLLLVTSLLGARTAMVTAAAGSVALVIAPLTASHPVDYVVPAVVLAGLIQLAAAWAGLSRLMSYVPRSVTIGFVNALGILIFLAQVPEVRSASLSGLGLFVLTIAIVLVAPRFGTTVPSPLIAVTVATVALLVLDLDTRTVADLGSTGGAPRLPPADVPWTLETLRIIAPTAVAIAAVGLLESLLTARVIDASLGGRSSTRRETGALGVANVAAGALGGVGGCAMIGQSVLNVEVGRSRSRASTYAAAATMAALLLVVPDLLGTIPVVSLSAVMMIVAARTVDWPSIMPSGLRRGPHAESLVMGLTVVVVVVTENLAIGVAIGALAAAVLLVRRMSASIEVQRQVVAQDQVTYVVSGPLFFVTSHDLDTRFELGEDPRHVTLDLSRARVWDGTSVHAVTSIIAEYRQRGTSLTLIPAAPGSLPVA